MDTRKGWNRLPNELRLEILVLVVGHIPESPLDREECCGHGRSNNAFQRYVISTCRTLPQEDRGLIYEVFYRYNTFSLSPQANRTMLPPPGARKHIRRVVIQARLCPFAWHGVRRFAASGVFPRLEYCTLQIQRELDSFSWNVALQGLHSPQFLQSIYLRHWTTFFKQAFPTAISIPSAGHVDFYGRAYLSCYDDPVTNLTVGSDALPVGTQSHLDANLIGVVLFST